MLAAVLCLLLTRPAPPAPAVPEPPVKADKADDGPGAGKFVVTDETQVYLDGERCKFADVPAGASIVGLAVAKDKRTITSIKFASKPK